MAYERLSVDQCKDTFTCPSVWRDSDDPEYAVVVGNVLDPSPVPVGAGERAVRLRVQTLVDARLVGTNDGS